MNEFCLKIQADARGKNVLESGWLECALNSMVVEPVFLLMLVSKARFKFLLRFFIKWAVV